MALGERLQLAPDAEEPADEILEMRGELDQEGRFVLAGERLDARREKPLAQIGGEALQKQRIDARQALALIEIGEGEVMGKLKLGHAGIHCSLRSTGKIAAKSGAPSG